MTSVTIIFLRGRSMKNIFLKKAISLALASLLSASTISTSVFAEKTADSHNDQHIDYYLESEHDHDCCDCHEEEFLGDGIKVAIVDSGITKYETANSISFVDNTDVNEHGNNMAEVLLDTVPNADILDARVLDSEGQGKYSDVNKAIKWAVNEDANIIVMSFEGYEASSVLENAVNYAESNGVLVIAASGNDGSERAVYPAAYPSVISAGATDEEGKVLPCSNYGEFVDTYAEIAGGTSMAAQSIAAKAAQLIQEYPDKTVSEIRAMISNNTKKELNCKSTNIDSIVYAAGCSHIPASSYTVTKAATCSSTGTKVLKCTKCSAILETKTIAKTGHSFNGVYTVINQPTCTSAGTKVGKCTKCGTVVSTVSIPALGHSYGSWITSKAATCTQNGLKYHKCSRCSNLETKTIAKTGHTFNGSYTTTKKATCTTAGIKAAKCTKCGTILSSAKIPALGHSYGSWITTKVATCTQNGSKYHKCSRCSKQETKTIAKTGHTFNGSYTTTKKATCTTAGIQAAKCTKCKTVLHTRKVSALGHNYKWVTTKKATCKSTGTQAYKCTRCGKVAKTKTISKTGHSFNGSFTTTKKPTCTLTGIKAAKCIYCGTVLSTAKIPALGHNYKWVTTKKATCKSTGTQAYKCTRCNKVSKTKTIPKNDTHNYQTIKQNGINYKKCSDCGIMMPEYSYQDYLNDKGKSISSSTMDDFKNYLISMGYDKDTVSLICRYATATSGKKINTSEFESFMNILGKIGEIGDLTGSEYASGMSTISSVGTYGCHIYNYVSALKGDPNSTELMSSFIDITSDILSLSPLTSGYSKILGNLKDNINDVIEKGLKHKADIYMTDIYCFYGEPTLADLAKQSEYDRFVKYCKDEFGRDGEFAANYYINNLVTAEFQRITGMSIDDYIKIFKGK